MDRARGYGHLAGVCDARISLDGDREAHARAHGQCDQESLEWYALPYLLIRTSGEPHPDQSAHHGAAFPTGTLFRKLSTDLTSVGNRIPIKAAALCLAADVANDAFVDASALSTALDLSRGGDSASSSTSLADSRGGTPSLAGTPAEIAISEVAALE